MARVHIAGLGPGSIDEISIGTLKLLKDNRLILRTSIHPVVDELNEFNIKIQSLDEMYEGLDNFDDIYNAIADKVIEKFKEEESDLVYAVPGNPMIAEKSVLILREKLQRENIPFIIHPAVSFIDAVMSSLGKDPIDGLLVVDALDIENKDFSRQADILITQVYNKRIASQVKLALSDFMDEEDEVYLLNSVGVKDKEVVKKVRLFELDRQEEIDHLTSVYVEKEKIKDSFIDVVRTTKTLRDKEVGCPWDKEQTHESLKRFAVEEAYEVVDAIEEEDIDNLEEELGDLLFQVLLHSRIEEEEGNFNINDVVRKLNHKMISRHPHVFKDLKLDTSDEVLNTWEEIKTKEKGAANLEEKLKGISKAFPASIRTREILKKSKSFGIPKPQYEQTINELREILSNLTNENKDKTQDLVRIIYLSYVLLDLLGEDPETLINGYLDDICYEISHK